jgi:hypothetical protein
MRGLCNKILPRDLNETLLFLGLARAMSYIINSRDVRDSQAEFVEDLGRWQLLFNENDGGQLAFREAVKAIWGVDISTFGHKLIPSGETLEQFQNMALNLVARADETYRCQVVNHLGLLATQARWRQRQQRPSSYSTLASLKESSSSDDGGPPGEASSPSIVEGLAEAAIQEDPLLDLIHDNSCSRKADMVLIILMAGAIFAMIIAFLLGESEFLSKLCCGTRTGLTSLATQL